MKSGGKRLILLATTLWMVVQSPAQEPSTCTLLILCHQDRRLAIVDATTLRPLARVDVGKDPREITTATDGRVAYLSHHGTITTFDLLNRKALGPLNLGSLTNPNGLTFVDGHLWFLADGNVIGRFNPDTHSVDLVLNTGQGCSQSLFVAKGERQIVLTSSCTNTLSLLERERTLRTPRSISEAISGGTFQHPGVQAPHAPSPPNNRPASDQWQTTTLQVGFKPQGLDFSRDGKQIWVANAQDKTISVLDWASKAVLATIPFPACAPERLKFTPDGTRVLVSGAACKDITVLDAGSHLPVGRIAVKLGASGLWIQPDGLRAYTICTQDDSVVVISLTKFAVLERLTSLKRPYLLSLAPQL